MSMYAMYTQEEVRVIVAEKDAEIERLKNIIRATEVERDAADKVCEHLRLLIESQQQLITELCDAMERQMIYPRLVQRAREATR